jgi:uncharacterized protein
MTTMQFHVAQLLKEQVGATRDYTIAEDIGDVFDHEITAVAPLEGKVHLIRTNRGIFLEARLHTTVRLNCGRCLEDYLAEIPMDIREEYLPIVDVNTGASLSMPEDVDYFTIDENHILDLTEVVRQYILVALPMQPLCRVDCAGLCPTCGQNLNTARCQCKPVPADERLAVLKDLLRDAEESEDKKNDNDASNKGQ